VHATTTVDTPTNRWTGAWLDAVAFALGLAAAWWFSWLTTDLVWSLWLSSLVVGYTLIVWKLSAPLRALVGKMEADQSRTASVGAKAVVFGVYAVGTLFGLAFFTVHFGMFHYVHSVFLESFFPVTDEPIKGLISWSVYAEVFSRYWWFLPAAFLAERQAFRGGPQAGGLAAVMQSGTANGGKRSAMMEPYKNVVRMHMLIFFFVLAHFARLENFAVYATVYAVYFFPWRVVRGG
jgi:Family of unknown function (DUF6498)